MTSKKIAGLGGGSFYFRRAIADLVLSEDLHGSEIVLYDIDGEKVEIMAAMGRRLADRAGTGFTVRSTTDLADAVDGADFALSSIGGSGAGIEAGVYSSPYHNADVVIPAKYGIHQMIGDTCGPAGMMMALRSIPVYIEICREMEKRCPDIILFNHSNPMAVLCRAMHKYSQLNVIGVCHGVQGGIVHTAKILDLPPDELDCVWIGTNHYYWFTRIYHQGKDVYPELRKRIAERKAPDGHTLSTKLSLIYDYNIVYPDDSHLLEFYPYLTQMRGGYDDLSPTLKKSLEGFVNKDHMPMPGEIEPTQQMRQDFLDEFQTLADKTELSEKQDNTITGEGIGAILSAIAHGRRQICIANIANQGAIPNLPHHAEVEVAAVTDSTGVRPLVMGEAPPILKAILEKRFVWHELVADAAVKGDRRLALQALMIDEMSIHPDKSEQMLDELLNASKSLLPQFFG